MSHYIECQGCGFVLEAAGPTEPVPKRWDACPDCQGSDFGFREE